MARANINLLSSVEGAVGKVQEMFNRAQDIKNRSEIMQRRRVIRDAQGEFQNEMLQRNVPATEWGREWKERLKDIRKTAIDDGNPPPAVKQAVSEVYDDFASSSYIQISGAALKQVRQDAEQDVNRDLDHLMRTKRYDEAKELVELNADIIGEKKVADMVRSIDHTANMEGLELSREIDPISHLEDLKNGVYDDQLSDLQKIEETRRTEEAQKRLEGEALQKVTQDIESRGLKTEEEIRNELDSYPHISEEAKKSYLKSFKNSKPLTQAEEMEIQDAIDANVDKFFKKEITPEEYREEWYRIRSKMEQYGPRAKRSGWLTSALFNYNPSYYTAEKQNQPQHKLAAERSKDVNHVARQLVAEHAKGRTSIKYAQEAITGSDLERSDKIKNEELQANLGSMEIVVRSALDQAVQEFIIGLPEGLDNTTISLKIREFLIQNADKVSLEALNKAEKVSLEAPPIPEDEKLRQEADSILNGAGSSALPKAFGE